VKPEFSSVLRQRNDLKFLEKTEVFCSGRVKELRKHPKRKDLDSLCLVNVIVTPIPLGESIYLDHLWVLRKQFTKIGVFPERNERVYFRGKVYSYRRLGGKSIDRGLYGTEDYGVMPVSCIEK
jgi:hypothetical protein